MPEAGLPQLPEAFEDLLAGVLPDSYLEEGRKSFAIEKPVCLRINPLRGEAEDIRRELEELGCRLEPVSWYRDAFFVPAEQRQLLTGSAAFAEGRIYPQSASSMLAPLLLAPRPGEEVLDLAAAPGGKTLLMAALMANRGRIAAVEAVKGRFHRLRDNVRRAGADIVQCYLADGRSIGRKVPGRFDRVLLDAPCSSEARFSRRNPDSWAHWSPRKVREMARKQQGLLVSALQACKPGGSILYCTCSLSPEENEFNIARLIKRFGDSLQLEKIEIPNGIPWSPGLCHWGDRELPRSLERSVRVLPGERFDAFYLALIRKTA
ncbi:MAG: RsmB/NOP family class I SAM-dependent RNA methyltransferase [Geothermobacteraceae bacterium]